MFGDRGRQRARNDAYDRAALQECGDLALGDGSAADDQHGTSFEIGKKRVQVHRLLSAEPGT
jgi:hypothetical protein